MNVLDETIPMLTRNLKNLRFHADVFEFYETIFSQEKKMLGFKVVC